MEPREDLADDDRLTREPRPALGGVREFLFRVANPVAQVVAEILIDRLLELLPHSSNKLGAAFDGHESNGEVYVLRRPRSGPEPEVHREASFEEPGRIRIVEQTGEQPLDHEFELERGERDLPLQSVLP